MIVIDAKKRFLSSADKAKAWDAITSSELFVEATQVALLHMHASMTPPDSMANAASNEIMMRGARLLIAHLSSLSVIAELPKRKDTLNLDHKV